MQDLRMTRLVRQMPSSRQSYTYANIGSASMYNFGTTTAIVARLGIGNGTSAPEGATLPTDPDTFLSWQAIPFISILMLA
jgi:hypothetical protein